jgi:hypothetical protein
MSIHLPAKRPPNKSLQRTWLSRFLQRAFFVCGLFRVCWVRRFRRHAAVLPAVGRLRGMLIVRGPNRDMTTRWPSGKARNRGRPISEVLRTAGVAACILVSVLLVGCSPSTPTATMSPSPVAPTPLSTAMTTEPVSTPTATAAPTAPESPLPSDPGELLKSAVANLQKATSFHMAVHAVRAYRAMEPDGATRMVVYGEFNTQYAVLRLPTLKVHATYEERYDPQAAFVKRESYTYQENGKHVTRVVEASGASYVEEVDPQRIEPLAGDVYQTVVTYADQAGFVAERDGVAVYVLDHPEWYRLQGAVGFADLGFLQAQENGEQLVKQYAAEHYPDVQTIRFTIYVSTDEQVITKVVVDDRDFMVSVWAAVDRALIEQGENPGNLTRYEVMRANGAEYLFSQYNQVQDFEIP